MHPKPNFFFIGGMRCGSTSLNLMLEQHPEIFMSPVKEPYFYMAEARREMAKTDATLREGLAAFEAGGKYRTAEAYAALFEGAQGYAIRGESSHYLYHGPSINLIRADCPDAKILVSIRNPIDRLFSEYLLATRDGKHDTAFKDYVRRNTAAYDAGKVAHKYEITHLNKGLQGLFVQHWIDAFGAANVKCVLFDDLQRAPKQVAREIFDWLGVDHEFEPEIVHTQKGGVAKNKGVINALNSQTAFAKTIKRMMPKMSKQKIRSWLYSKVLTRPEIEAETAAYLYEFYRDDIQKLSRIVDQDLGNWVPAQTTSSTVAAVS